MDVLMVVQQGASMCIDIPRGVYTTPITTLNILITT